MFGMGALKKSLPSRASKTMGLRDALANEIDSVRFGIAAALGAENHMGPTDTALREIEGVP